MHRATLFSGEQVVVKVQRPGLKQLFDIDLNNLRILAEQLDKGDENRWGRVLARELGCALGGRMHTGTAACASWRRSWTKAMRTGGATGVCLRCVLACVLGGRVH